MRPFAYSRAQTSADASRAAEGAKAQFLAGGTTLLDLAKLDVMQPESVVDINALQAQHGGIALDASGLKLGALVRMSVAAAHPGILREYPVIAQSLALAASPQIRNMASLGGNVLQRTRCSYFRDTTWGACNKRTPGSGCAALTGVNRSHAVLGTSDACIATYHGDFAQALIALGARVEITFGNNSRVIPFEQLHRLPEATPHIENILKPGEIITGFQVPAGAWTKRSLYLKIRDRQSYEFALASVAVALELKRGVVVAARLGLGGVATKPWRASAAEALLVGKRITEETAAQAADAAFADAKTHNHNNFKPELGRRAIVRALLQAAAMEV